jgi:hypothetical protein
MPPRKLWQRKLTDGAEIRACLWHDSALSEATIELSIRAVVADTLAANMADERSIRSTGRSVSTIQPPGTTEAEIGQPHFPILYLT